MKTTHSLASRLEQADLCLKLSGSGRLADIDPSGILPCEADPLEFGSWNVKTGLLRQQSYADREVDWDFATHPAKANPWITISAVRSGEPISLMRLTFYKNDFTGWSQFADDVEGVAPDALHSIDRMRACCDHEMDICRVSAWMHSPSEKRRVLIPTAVCATAYALTSTIRCQALCLAQDDLSKAAVFLRRIGGRPVALDSSGNSRIWSNRFASNLQVLYFDTRFPPDWFNGAVESANELVQTTPILWQEHANEAAPTNV